MVDRETLEQKKELFRVKIIAKRCIISVTNYDGEKMQIAHEPECRDFCKLLRGLIAGKSQTLVEIIDRKEATGLVWILDRWLRGRCPSEQQQDRLLRSLKKVRAHFTEQYGELMTQH